MSDITQLERKLGSFTTDPTTYIREFQWVLQAYSLTHHDIYMLLANTLLPEERRRVWELAQAHADENHRTNPNHPTGPHAVPEQDPLWDYNTPEGLQSRDLFTSCLLAGLKKATRKAVNFQKVQEVIQRKEETPSEFLDRLTKALQQYTNLDPETPDGRHVLMTYFLAQSYPDIKAKLKKLEQGPATPQTEILAVAFKVFHGREDESERRRQRAENAKFQMLAQVIQRRSSPRRPNKTPPGACFKCGKEGHWAKDCPSPRTPSTPCPKCHQRGHWGVDCPTTRKGGWSAARQPQPLLGLAEED